MYKVNTSNPGKLAEFERFLNQKLESFKLDLKEPLADPITIVRYKASQFEDVIVDDTSLDVEGADVGVNVKWLLDELDRYLGKTARFRCLIGIQRSDHLVHIYEGKVEGTIVPARGVGFGFNPVFQPKGRTKTLAEEMPDDCNARFLAVQNLLTGKSLEVVKPLKEWKGEFQ